ncbi:MAG: hypothetical protein Kow0031_40110 [Anaerolineae bacterium]
MSEYGALKLSVGLLLAGTIFFQIWVRLPGGGEFSTPPVYAAPQAEQGDTPMRFPIVAGANLERQKLTLPDDFEGDLNVVVIAFEQWQQSLVDTWIPHLQQLEAENPELRYYELPTIREMNIFSRTFINEGMRMGIPNDTARQRTITLYLDKRAFKVALDIRTERTITVLLVNRAGEVVWRTSGPFSPELGATLAETIRRHAPEEAQPEIVAQLP